MAGRVSLSRAARVQFGRRLQDDHPMTLIVLRPDELPDIFAFDNCRQALETWKRMQRHE